MDTDAIRQKREEIVEEFLASIRSLIDDSTAEIERLEEQGREYLDRYDDLCSELADIDAELPGLKLRQEDLPVQTYREYMRGNSLEEEALHGEFQRVESELERLENRRQEVAAELEEMTPHGHVSRQSPEERRERVEQEAYGPAREVKTTLYREAMALLEPAAGVGGNPPFISAKLRAELRKLPGEVPESLSFSPVWRQAG